MKETVKKVTKRVQDEVESLKMYSNIRAILTLLVSHFPCNICDYDIQNRYLETFFHHVSALQ